MLIKLPQRVETMHFKDSPVVFANLDIIPTVSITTVIKHTICIKLLVDFSLNLLFMPFNKLLITPIAIIIDNKGKYLITISMMLENKLAKRFS